MSEWTKDYFENAYLRRWRFGPPGIEAKERATQIAHLLELTYPSRVADIGCGHGRYSITLAEMGFEVVGFDASEAVLDLARQLARDANVPVNFTLADMRALPRGDLFDGALLLDSFGFFPTQVEDVIALREIGSLLRPGGRLLIKVVNGGLIRSSFEPSYRSQEGDRIETINRELIHDGGMMVERITLEDAEGTIESYREQRLYDRPMLEMTLSSSGFKGRFYGGFDLASVRKSSPYFVIVATLQ